MESTANAGCQHKGWLYVAEGRSWKVKYFSITEGPGGSRLCVANNEESFRVEIGNLHDLISIERNATTFTLWWPSKSIKLRAENDETTDTWLAELHKRMPKGWSEGSSQRPAQSSYVTESLARFGQDGLSRFGQVGGTSNSFLTRAVELRHQRTKGPTWMRDSAVSNCFECNKAFTLFNRKHHCRVCGRIFCDTCSSRRLQIEGQAKRVCDHCYEEQFSFSASASTEAVGHGHARGVPQLPLYSHSEEAHEEVSEERVAERLAEAEQRAEEGGAGEGAGESKGSPRKSLPSSLGGGEWEHARERGYSNADEPEEGVEGLEVEEGLRAEEQAERGKARGQLLWAAREHWESQARFAVEAEGLQRRWRGVALALVQAVCWYATAGRLPLQRAEGGAGESEDKDGRGGEVGGSRQGKEEGVREALKPLQMPASAGEAVGRGGDGVGAGQEGKGGAEGLGRSGGGSGGRGGGAWVVSAKRLMEERLHLLPTLGARDGDVAHFGKHCKVKRVPGGEAAESAWVSGVVFSNQVVHKRMAQAVASPRLLLLGCAVEYGRGAKFVPLANLAQQEREYLRIAVHRILRLKPDVVLVEKSMAQEAKKELREAGVTVVVEVKRSILQRLSAATGIEIAASVELLGTQDNLCREVVGGSFSVVALTPRGKPLVCVDAGPRSLTPRACTLLLRGHGSALDRAKAVVCAVMYAACAMHTEAAFLADLGCSLPPFYTLLCSGRAVPAANLDSSSNNRDDDALGSDDDSSDERIAADSSNASNNDNEADGSARPHSNTDDATASSNAQSSAEVGVETQVTKTSLEASAEASEEGDVPYRLLAMSPHVALRLPEEVCAELSRGEQKHRVTTLLRNLTAHAEAPSPEHSGTGGIDGVAAEGSWTLVEEGSGLERGKARQRLCRLTAEQIVQHAPRAGFVWGVPGQGVDCRSTDALRVLFTSHKTGGGGGGGLLPAKELWLGFNSDRDLSLMQFLHSYCFSFPAAASRGQGSGAPDQEHFFVHADGRVRVKVLRRAEPGGGPGQQSRRGSTETAAPGDPNGVWVRTRCLSCARTTNAGSALGRGARHIALGRFLQNLVRRAEGVPRITEAQRFFERRLTSMDGECQHPLHAQLIMFSLGSSSAMFVHEPIPLCQVIPPRTGLEPLAAEVEQRFVQLELQETLEATEKLSQWGKQHWEGPAALVDSLLELRSQLGKAALDVIEDQHQRVTRPVALAYKRRLLSLAADMLDKGGAAPSTSHSLHSEVSVVLDRHAAHDGDDALHQPVHLHPSPQLPEPGVKSRRGSAEPGVPYGSPTTPTNVNTGERISMGSSVGSSEGKAPGLVRANSMVTGGRGKKRTAVRPTMLEGTILSDAPGRCCFIIPNVANNGEEVPVYEGDPGSIIVMTLRSKAYSRALFKSTLEPESSEPVLARQNSGLAAAGGMMVGAHFVESTRSLHAGGGAEERNDKEIHHVRVEMDNVGPGGGMMLACKIYFAKKFEELREHYCRGCGGEEGLLQSLSRCQDWRPTGGSTGVAYFKTADQRFVLKEISQREHRHFLQAAKEYFEYVTKTMDGELHSCLAKVLGLFKLTTRTHKAAASTSRVLILMENLLYRGEDCGPLRVFDLKGSSRNRYIKEAKRGDVQLDENFHAYVQQSPLYLSENAKNLLTSCIYNDTVFLAKVNVMDYSLLVAIDEECNVISFGIIDYIRQYTMDKQAESYYKMAIDRVAMKGMHEPTVIAPPEYSKRFQEAMAKNFTHSPSTFAICRAEQEQRIDAEGAGGVTHDTVDWGVHDISGLFQEPSSDRELPREGIQSMDGDPRKTEAPVSMAAASGSTSSYE